MKPGQIEELQALLDSKTLSYAEAKKIRKQIDELIRKEQAKKDVLGEEYNQITLF